MYHSPISIISIPAPPPSDFPVSPASQDYIRIVQAVKDAMAARTDQRLVLQQRMGSLESKRAAHAKLAGAPGKEDKAQKAQSECLQAESAVEEARMQLDLVTARVMRETERFKQEKAQDFKAAVCDFVNLQIEHAKKVEETWTALLPVLESVEVVDEVTIASAGIGAADDGKAE